MWTISICVTRFGNFCYFFVWERLGPYFFARRSFGVVLTHSPCRGCQLIRVIRNIVVMAMEMMSLILMFRECVVKQLRLWEWKGPNLARKSGRWSWKRWHFNLVASLTWEYSQYQRKMCGDQWRNWSCTKRCRSKALQEQKEQSWSGLMWQRRCRLHGASWRASKPLKRSIHWKGWHNWQPSHRVTAFIFQRAFKAWHSIISLTRVWKVWPSRAVFKAWGSASNSTRVWQMWHCPEVFTAWLLVVTSTRVWKMWHCLQVFTAWLLVVTSTRVW